VAEGIETVAMVAHVRGAGVACAQGYLLGRPDAALAPTPAFPQTLSA
jgi:EAL domain-containing protein (putative c-di-GMP-specific phosphodiesterase class I)